MKARMLGAVACAALLAGAPDAAGQDLYVVGGRVHPVGGPPIEDGVVWIRDGRIAAVGPASGVDVPAAAPRIDARGAVVTPGFFDPGTRLGLVEVSLEGTSVDTRLSAEDPVRAAFDVTDGLNPRSVLIPEARLGGVTAAASRPEGGVIAGRAAVIALDGPTVEAMAVRPRAAVVASVGADGSGARGGATLRLREALEDARFWAEHREAFDRGASRSLTASRLDLAALQPVLAGEVPLVVSVHRASDIEAVLRLADEYGFRPVLEGAEEGWLVAERLAGARVPVVVKPLANLPQGFDRLGTRFDNAALLHAAGVPVALSGFDSHNARNLRVEAGNAVRFGMPWEAALRAVTLTPAEAWGVADRLGSLEPGKRGDLVVWSGDPFELSTRVRAVVVGGRSLPLRSRQTELFERYRELDAGPPAYRGGREAAAAP